MNDLRLVPAATATWLACALGVGWTSGALLGVVAASMVCAVGIGVLSRNGPDHGAATAWLALVAVAVALGSCAAQVHARDEGLLARLAAEGATATAVGTVRSEAVPVASAWGEPRMRFELAVEQVTGRGLRGDAAAAVLVITHEQHVRYGSRVEVTGHLAAVPAGDTVRAVLRPLGDVVQVAPPGAVDAVVGRIRSALLEVTDPLSPDLRGLVPGAAIGDTTRLPPDLEQAMRDVSLTHITAVSGGHFAVLSMSVLALTALLGLPIWGRAVATAAAMAGFVLLVHPDPSVVRAAGMGALGVVGMLLGRPSRAIPALCAVVVALLVLDPWLARSYGFVLSVLATAAIVVAAPRIAARLAMLPRWLAMAVAVPVAAQAVCGPVLVLLDPSVGVYAVPANLLAAPGLLPATVLGVLAALVAPWAPAVAGVLAHAAGVAAWWIAAVARVFAGLPAARQDWASGPVGALALLAATVAALAVVPAVRRWGRWVVVVAVAAIAVVLALPGWRGRLLVWPPRDWRVVACDVGQGDALVVRSGTGAAVVVDVGPEGRAADSCLDRLGITRIDLLVLTHYHADHVGGLAAVLDGRDVVAAMVSPLVEPADQAQRVAALLEAAGVPVQVGSAEGPVTRGAAGQVAWAVLSPVASLLRAGDPDAANDASVVLLLRAPDLTVLALGDAEPPAQEHLAQALTRSPPSWDVDVVKVAHHGSAYQSDRLIELLAPRVALISAGADNEYGHPAARTVDAFRGVGALVLGTHECGPVAVAPGPGGLEVSARCLGGR